MNVHLERRSVVLVDGCAGFRTKASVSRLGARAHPPRRSTPRWRGGHPQAEIMRTSIDAAEAECSVIYAFAEQVGRPAGSSRIVIEKRGLGRPVLARVATARRAGSRTTPMRRSSRSRAGANQLDALLRALASWPQGQILGSWPGRDPTSSFSTPAALTRRPPSRDHRCFSIRPVGCSSRARTIRHRCRRSNRRLHPASTGSRHYQVARPRLLGDGPRRHLKTGRWDALVSSSTGNPPARARE